MKTAIKSIPFESGKWNTTVNVYDFIVNNIKPYTGDASFLVGPSQKTNRLWDVCKQTLLKERENNGVLAIDTETISTMTAFGPVISSEKMK